MVGVKANFLPYSENLVCGAFIQLPVLVSLIHCQSLHLATEIRVNVNQVF